MDETVHDDEDDNKVEGKVQEINDICDTSRFSMISSARDLGTFEIAAEEHKKSSNE